MDRYSFRFPQGSTHLMVGPSASGKTFRTCEILKIKDKIIENGNNIKNIVVTTIDRYSRNITNALGYILS